MATGKRVIDKEYVSIRDRFDLDKFDTGKNQDKVYHIAVAERLDGMFDVLCRHGRRGTKLQDFVYEEKCGLSSARNMAGTKFREKERKGYNFIISGGSAGLWKDVLLDVVKNTQDGQDGSVDELSVSKPSMSENAKVPDFAPPEWMY